MYTRLAFAAVLLPILGAGCAAKRQSYRLVPWNGGAMLMPPGVDRPELAQRKFTAAVTPGPKACPAGSDAVRATKRGKGLRLEVNGKALAAQPQGWLWNWTAEAESQGCIAPGEGLRLASRIVESVPLDVGIAHRQLLAAPSLSSVEIGPQSRVQVVTPIMRDGASPDSPLMETTSVSGSGRTINVDVKASDSLLGFETAWYAVVPKPAGVGFTLAALSVERNIQGRTESAATPLANYLRFSPESNFYRLFLKADVEGNAVTQMLITAPTRAELNRRTKAIDADPSLCGAGDGLCVAIPRRAAINIWTAVSVNGKEVRIRGGALRAAIAAAGEKDLARVLPTLAIERPFNGKLTAVEFDRNAPSILDLALVGGERITW
jgi:hypothetical protein